jgi:hypothetical protein
LPFDYVLNLISQSQAWCYLGSTAGTLAPLGLGDARAIAKLMSRVDAMPRDADVDAVIAAAAKVATVDPLVLQYAFRQLADDGYTKFLVQFAD